MPPLAGRARRSAPCATSSHRPRSGSVKADRSTLSAHLGRQRLDLCQVTSESGRASCGCRPSASSPASSSAPCRLRLAIVDLGRLASASASSDLPGTSRAPSQRVSVICACASNADRASHFSSTALGSRRRRRRCGSGSRRRRGDPSARRRSPRSSGLSAELVGQAVHLHRVLVAPRSGSGRSAGLRPTRRRLRHLPQPISMMRSPDSAFRPVVSCVEEDPSMRRASGGCEPAPHSHSRSADRDHEQRSHWPCSCSAPAGHRREGIGLMEELGDEAEHAASRSGTGRHGPEPLRLARP